MALSDSIKSNNGSNTYWLEIITNTSENTVYATARLWSASHPGGYGYAAGSAFPLKIIIGGVTCIDGNYPLTSNTWVSYNAGDGRKSYADLASTSLATGGGAITVYAEYTNNYSNHNWAMKLYQTLSVSDTVYPVTPGNPSVNVGYSNVGRTTATISGSVISWGDYASAGSYNLACSDGSSGQNTSRNLTNLTPNTRYTVTFSATNNYGKSASKSTFFTTTHNSPSIGTITPTVGDTTCTFPTSGSGITYDNAQYAHATIKYRVEGTSSWATLTTSDSPAILSGLDIVTTYEYEYTITDNANGVSNTVTGTFTTTGQSKARLKINGTWKKGRVFLKKNGEWVVSKKIFIKKNGSWTETKN